MISRKKRIALCLDWISLHNNCPQEKDKGLGWAPHFDYLTCYTGRSVCMTQLLHQKGEGARKDKEKTSDISKKKKKQTCLHRNGFQGRWQVQPDQHSCEQAGNCLDQKSSFLNRLYFYLFFKFYLNNMIVNDGLGIQYSSINPTTSVTFPHQGFF